MINVKPKILMIDDFGEGRRETINALEKLSSVDVKTVLPFEIVENPKPTGANWEPNLIFLDFKFEHDPKKPEGVIDGRDLVSLVRRHYPGAAIYLLSVVIPVEDEQTRPNSFERQVSDQYLSRLDIVVGEALDHYRLQELNLSEAKNFMTFIGCPEDDIEDMESDLRPLFLSSKRKGSPSNAASAKSSLTPPLELFRWMMDRFFAYPGFLLNEEAIALRLGCTAEYFKDNLLKQFSSALYTGPFHSGRPKYWWSSTISQILMDMDEEGSYDVRAPNRSAATILKIPTENLAKCALCDGLYPEALGYVTDEANTKMPVHIACSEPDEAERLNAPYLPPRIIEG